MFNGEALKQMRTQKGLSIADFAFELDRKVHLRLTTQTIYNLESEKTDPRFSTVMKLAKFFKVKPSIFLSENGPRPRMINGQARYKLSDVDATLKRMK